VSYHEKGQGKDRDDYRKTHRWKDFKGFSGAAALVLKRCNEWLLWNIMQRRQLSAGGNHDLNNNERGWKNVVFS
jgi:hypothetical protein